MRTRRRLVGQIWDWDLDLVHRMVACVILTMQRPWAQQSQGATGDVTHLCPGPSVGDGSEAPGWKWGG